MTTTETRPQTLAQARRIHDHAITSENQADDYASIIEAIRGLGTSETFATEIARLNGLHEEFLDDADDLRGQIETRHIDSL